MRRLRAALVIASDPLVLVPLLLLVVLAVSAATHAEVTVWTVEHATAADTWALVVPLWLCELVVLAVAAVVFALIAYALGDE